MTCTESPEEDIIEILYVLENLPDTPKKKLQDSQKKVFDIGFECGALEAPINAELSAKTVQRISQIECLINIKLYPWVKHPYKD